MRRKRATVTAAAAAVLVALVGLAMVLTVQARANHDLTAANERERARFDLAMESIRTFHAGVSQDVLLREPQFQALRGKLLHGAREFSLKLEALLKDQTDLRSRRALAQAYDELAELTERIGSKSEALELYRHVLALRRELARGAQTDSDEAAAIARCLLAVGSLQFETGHPDLAMSAYEEARTLLQAPDRPPVIVSRRADLATCYHQMGDALAAMGRSAEAMVWFQKARSLREALVRDHPDITVFRTALANSHDAIGVLLWAGGRPTAAVRSFEKARAILVALARDHAGDTELLRQLASSSNAMGFPLHSMGKTEQALESFERAREILESLVHDNPAVTDFRRQLAYSYAQIGTLLSDIGRPAEAVSPYEKAQALLETLAHNNPAVAEIRNDLARCYSQLGHVLTVVDEPALAARSHVRKLVRFARPWFSPIRPLRPTSLISPLHWVSSGRCTKPQPGSPPQPPRSTAPLNCLMASRRPVPRISTTLPVITRDSRELPSFPDRDSQPIGLARKPAAQWITSVAPSPPGFVWCRSWPSIMTWTHFGRVPTSRT